MLRTCIGILMLLVIFFSVSQSLAVPTQRQDTTRRLYDRVMDEFKHRDYEAAMAGFRLFIELHSQSSLAANAQYWIGECQYRMRRYRDALKSFYGVVSNYPLSPKLAASTLKLGQTYTKLGDHEKARLMFDRVVKQYPDSSEAEVAHKAIEAMASTEDQTHSIAVGRGDSMEASRLPSLLYNDPQSSDEIRQ
jgi:tol-pal system protein YbgF